MLDPRDGRPDFQQTSGEELGGFLVLYIPDGGLIPTVATPPGAPSRGDKRCMLDELSRQSSWSSKRWGLGHRGQEYQVRKAARVLTPH